MTLQELRYLVAVADHGHFGRAAAACHVTQPTLSAGIRSLEHKLDLRVCDRGPQGAVITRDGAPVVEQARRVLAEAWQLELIARRGREPLTGVYRLGAIPTIGPYLLPRVVPDLRTRHPSLRLHLIEGTTDQLLRDLHHGDLDIVLLSPPVDVAGLDHDLLYRERFLAALPGDHPLARRPAVQLDDLEDEPLLLLDEGHCLRDQVVEFCRIADARARELIRSSSLETLRNMVVAGIGCTLLPELAVGEHEACAIRPITRPTPSREVRLYWRSSDPRGESARLLATRIREAVSTSVETG
ncbi:LysR family transcriptional regulator [bacterium]|nr:LysR family transcriptional regulator [bacterium]